MYLIVMNQGNSHDKLPDDLWDEKKKQVYFNSVTSTWNVKGSTETSWFSPKKLTFKYRLCFCLCRFAFVNGSHAWHFLNTFIKCNWIVFTFDFIISVSFWQSTERESWIKCLFHFLSEHYVSTSQLKADRTPECIQMQSMITPPQEI